MRPVVLTPWLVGAVCRLVPVLCAVVPARAADVPPRPAGPTEQVDVSLHLLDVVVLDTAGKALHGLGPKNFAVTVDGEAREVRTVDHMVPAYAVPSTAIKPSAGEAAPEPAPRWALPVYDADRIDPAFRAEALTTARLVVEKALRTADRVAVAVIHDGEARFVHPFARTDQFDEAVLSGTALLAASPDGMAQKLREMAELVSGCGGGGQQSSCAVTATAEFLQFVRRGNKASLSALVTLATALRPLPGRKALFRFGDGILLAPGYVVLAAVDRFLGGGSLMASRFVDPPDWDYESFLTAASRARVTVFPMRTGQPLENLLREAGSNRGMQNMEDTRGASSDPFHTAATDMESNLQRVAESTGGRVVPLSAGPVSDPALLDRLESLYTLGIAPVAGDGIRSRVKIKLVGVKGKIVAPDHLLRRTDRGADLTGSIDVSSRTPGAPPGVSLALDLARLAADRGVEGAAPQSRIAVYWRALDAAGRVLADDYTILQIPRPPGTPARFTQPLPDAASGGAVLQVFVSDLGGRGGLSLTHTFASPPGEAPQAP